MSACGEWAFLHVPSNRILRWFCGSGKCQRPECRNLFWSRRVRLISTLIDEFNLIRFFTLTLDRNMIPSDIDPWDYIHHPWSKFRKRMKRRFPEFRFVSILEAHKNKDYPHIHGFTNVWMSQKDWSELWESCQGGKVVWIERVKGGDSGEISNYVSKSLEVAKYVGKENLLEGYKKRKNHRTLWRSENTKAKYELTKSDEWVMIKERVYNEEGQMLDYFAQKGVWSNVQEKQ